MITYQNDTDILSTDLAGLFGSLNWESGKYPEKLAKAMQNSDSVFTARENGKLIGLVNAISDGHMIVYFHYLIVHPDFHGQGIGRELMNRMLTKYQSIHRKILIAYNEAVGFYKTLGFTISENTSAMSL